MSPAVAAVVPDPAVLASLFDQLPDVVFFVKDREGRYLLANRTLRERCGMGRSEDLAGRTAEQVFPPPLGKRYAAQDRQVIASGAAIRDRLELHVYPGGTRGWCLTCKMPLRGPGGEVVGLVGISRDLHRPDRGHPEYRRLARALAMLRERHAEVVRLAAVARRVGLSMDTFARLTRRVFGLTPQQLLTQLRVETASRLLSDRRLTTAEVAHAAGYADHSAFSRQFKATVGLTPRAFRTSLGLS